VNVNHYLATSGAPVPVAVKVEKVNPTVEVVHYDTLILDHTGQERTAVRFRLADGGSVIDVNHREKIAHPADPQRSPYDQVTLEEPFPEKPGLGLDQRVDTGFPQKMRPSKDKLSR